MNLDRYMTINPAETAQVIAKRCRLHVATVHRVRNGDHIPNGTTIALIVNACPGVTADDLSQLAKTNGKRKRKRRVL